MKVKYAKKFWTVAHIEPALRGYTAIVDGIGRIDAIDEKSIKDAALELLASTDVKILDSIKRGAFYSINRD